MPSELIATFQYFDNHRAHEKEKTNGNYILIQVVCLNATKFLKSKGYGMII